MRNGKTSGQHGPKHEGGAYHHAAIAEQQKSRVDPMYHEKIDHLLDTYARKLAENMNQGFAIDARVMRGFPLC